MTSYASNEFIIHDFESTVNGFLKSSKLKPLINKKKYLLKIWHQGKGTKLLKVEDNKIYMVSRFKIRGAIIKRKIQVALEVILDNEQNQLQLLFNLIDISWFPEGLERSLNKLIEDIDPIDIPEGLLNYKEIDKPIELEIKMIDDNSLSVYLKYPIAVEKLALLRSKT